MNAGTPLLKLVTLTGLPASGKSAVAAALIKRLNLKRIPVATDRKPRPGDRHGEYEYLDQRDLDRLISAGEIVAYERLDGQSYGIRLEALNNLMEKPGIGVAILTLGRVRIIRSMISGHHHVASIFLPAPTDDQMWVRLRAVGSDPDLISSRLMLHRRSVPEAQQSEIPFYVPQACHSLGDLIGDVCGHVEAIQQRFTVRHGVDVRRP